MSNSPVHTPAAWRVHLLRSGYLLLVVGLGIVIWPGVIHHTTHWSLMAGVERSMLAALSALSVLGLFYPLRMLPLLLFELLWKTIWLLAVALPEWQANTMDADMLETVYECLGAVIFVVIIPWPYVIRTYVLPAAAKPSAA